MSEIKVGYRAVYYSGEEKIDVNPVRKSQEEAEKDIQRANENYSMFKYTPWSHAQVEKVHYRH